MSGLTITEAESIIRVTGFVSKQAYLEKIPMVAIRAIGLYALSWVASFGIGKISRFKPLNTCIFSRNAVIIAILLFAASFFYCGIKRRQELNQGLSVFGAPGPVPEEEIKQFGLSSFWKQLKPGTKAHLQTRMTREQAEALYSVLSPHEAKNVFLIDRCPPVFNDSDLVDKEKTQERFKVITEQLSSAVTGFRHDQDKDYPILALAGYLLVGLSNKQVNEVLSKFKGDQDMIICDVALRHPYFANKDDRQPLKKALLGRRSALDGEGMYQHFSSGFSMDQMYPEYMRGGRYGAPMVALIEDMKETYGLVECQQ